MSVGVDHDTASFAVNAIRSWWQMMGRDRYPDAHRLLITADCGGSNGARVRLWKRELNLLADELGLTITVCHLPPGTSKWNKIEHRLFSFITQNWRGKPLVSYQTIVQLIAEYDNSHRLEHQVHHRSHDGCCCRSTVRRPVFCTGCAAGERYGRRRNRRFRACGGTNESRRPERSTIESRIF